MAQIELKIEVNGDSSSETISGITQSQTGNNIGLKSGFPQAKSDGFEALSWVQNQEDPNVWELFFNADGNLANSKDGISGTLQSEENPAIFVWGKTDANGAKEITLTITGNNIDNIEVIGNKIANQFPIECIVDGTDTFYSDDNDWNIKLNTQSSSHTIKFTKWNRPNYNACISFIGIMVQYYTIDRYNGLKNLESLAESTPDPKSVVYGCLANSGSAEIVDVGGEIGDLINDKILDPSNVPMKVLVNGKEIQSHISIDSNYSNEQVFTIEFTNKLADLDGLKYQGYPYPETSKTAYELLTDVLQKLYGQSFDVDATMSSATKAKLQAISIEYPYIEANQTYRAVIDSICELAQLQMYAKDNGSIYFINARPVFESGHSIIKIPRRNQFSKFTYDMFIKNKFDGVEMNETSVNDIIEYNTIVNTYKGNTINSIFGNKDYDDKLADASSGLTLIYYIGYSKIEQNYTLGEYNVDLKSSGNLKKIIDVYSTGSADQDGYVSVENVNYTCNYKSSTDSITDISTLKTDLGNPASSTNTFGTLDNYTNVTHGTLSDVTTTTIPDTFGGGIGYGVYTVYSNVDDQSYIKFKISNNKLYVKYKILTDIEYFHINRFWTNYGEDDITLTDIQRYVAQDISFSIYGNQKVISFEEVSASTEGIETKKSKVTLNDNTLLQDNILINGNKLSSVIKTNILNDYKNGVRTAELTICCGDYYDTNGNKIKNFDNGDMLEIGDYVKVLKDNDNESALKYSDGSDYLWKVTSRKFYYRGSPMIDLTLQEITEGASGLFNSNGEQIYTWKELKNNGYIIVSGTTLSGVTGTLSGRLVIDNEITTIGSSALENQTSLIMVEIPDSVTSIGSQALKGCTGLVTITIGNGISSLPTEFLRNCTNLKNVIIKENLTTIGARAFYFCNSIEQIILPSSLAKIYDDAFSICTNLTSVIFKNTSSTWKISQYSSGGGTVYESAYQPINTDTNATYLKTTYSSYYWNINT